MDSETIRIDFEVYKALTMRRSSAAVSYNDVLRELLDLPAQRSGRTVQSKKSGWTTKGVTFPNGTEFRGRYKGREYLASVETGALVVNGKRFSSPSPAAMTITKTQTDGWKFWQCRRPGDVSWTTIKALRS